MFHTQGMTTPQPHQPAMSSVVNVQKAEIDRLNDNRIYLLALVEELSVELANARAQLLEKAVLEEPTS